MPPKKCPSTKVNRKSFTRTTSTGKKVHVKRTCVPDKGKPGKTLKRNRVLPKLNRDISLSKYGYALKKTSRSRHASLARASSKHNPRKVLGRLNLIRNYTAEPDNKEKLSEDVEWMSGFYAKHKASDGRRKTSKSKKASLKRASLRRASLKRASLKRASLKRASLKRASLKKQSNKKASKGSKGSKGSKARKAKKN